MRVIELLVGTVLVGGLTAIAVPMYYTAVSHAESASTKNSTQQGLTAQQSNDLLGSARQADGGSQPPTQALGGGEATSPGAAGTGTGASPSSPGQPNTGLSGGDVNGAVLNNAGLGGTGQSSTGQGNAGLDTAGLDDAALKAVTDQLTEAVAAGSTKQLSDQIRAALVKAGITPEQLASGHLGQLLDSLDAGTLTSAQISGILGQ